MTAQELQLLYSRSRDLPEAKRRLWRILDRGAQSDVPELLRLARTLDQGLGKVDLPVIGVAGGPGWGGG